jgi:hypothetical protein
LYDLRKIIPCRWFQAKTAKSRHSRQKIGENKSAKKSSWNQSADRLETFSNENLLSKKESGLYEQCSSEIESCNRFEDCSLELANASSLMKTLRVKQLADRLGKHLATIFRWLNQGLDLDSEDSIQQFLSGKKRRRNPNAVRKSEKKNTSAAPVADPQELEHVPQSDLNLIELAPVGRRGAAAALQRLEEIEERAHARLMRAIEAGNQFQVKAAQEFYLRTSETLRRLDLAVETERRNSEEQVPKRQAEAISLHIAEWLRIAFAQFLSSESRSLLGIKDPAEFRLYAIDRFRGIVFAAVKTSRKTNSPIPTWAEAMVIASWNATP